MNKKEAIKKINAIFSIENYEKRREARNHNLKEKK